MPFFGEATGFTFQYGSIKSIILAPAFIMTLIFTFQYGSIKRVQMLLLPTTIPHLHSNMVRLKVAIWSVPLSTKKNLHSNMVRLKGYKNCVP